MHNVEDAWFFLHTLFELIWEYRFLYRDLNDLLSKKPPPGNPFPGWCCTARKRPCTMLEGMQQAQALLPP